MVGKEAGAPASRPEQLLRDYDLVFAKARCALEAMAVCAAVVLCHGLRMGPLVTSGDFDRLRSLNFGRRALVEPLSAAGLLREIERYDAADALTVAKRVREESGVDRQLDRLLALYEEAIERGRSTPVDPAQESRATAVYLRQWAPQFHRLREDHRRALAAERRLGEEAQARTGAEARLAELEGRRGEIVARERTSEARAAEAQAQLRWVTSTVTWRAREWLLRSGVVRWAWRLVRRVRPSKPR